MVCLTSCVFRSIRFSGFARPHRLGCGARENYTRTCGRGQACGRRYMRRTQIGGYCLFETAFSEEGRAGAASPTTRANRPGFGALGRAEARRPSGRRPRNGRPRQASLQRPPPIKGGDTSGEKRVRHPKFSARPCPQGCALPYAAPSLSISRRLHKRKEHASLCRKASPMNLCFAGLLCSQLFPWLYLHAFFWHGV